METGVEKTTGTEYGDDEVIEDEEEDLIEDTSELGEDEDYMSEVKEHIEE